MLQALWSPGPVRHDGAFFTIDNVDLLPKPAQRPHPPIWVGGRWPNKAPFRRAARYDGVMPTHAAYSHDSFMRVDELREIVDYIGRHRTERGTFDVVMEGQSNDAEHLAQLAPSYAAVGLTWWIEKLGWWRGNRDAAHVRVQRGPR